MTSNTDSLLINNYRSMLLLSNNINSFSNNTIFQNDLSINNSLFNFDGFNINNNLTNNSDIYIKGSSNIQNNITVLNNLYSSTNSNLYNVSLGSDLLISNKSLLTNANINNNLIITNNSVFNNNITLNSNLYISNTAILNNVTMNSILITNNLTSNNSSTNSTLYVSNNSIINNITLTSNLLVSNNSNLIGNTTLLSFINVSNSFIANNISELSNIEITGLSFINNNFNIASNATINNTLTVNNTANFNNLNITGTITTILPEYDSNINADIGGVPVWGFYRTGGILKIKLNTIAPTITLLGNNTVSILINSLYTDPGIIALDKFNNTIIPYITNISYSGVNYLTTQIAINTGPTQIPTFNSLLSGNQIITYIAVDNNNNQSTITRTINVTLDTHAPQITLNGSDIINLKVNNNYIEQGVIVKIYNLAIIPTYNLISPTPTYLYIQNDYSILGTSNWTIETYIYLNYYNSCILIDFRRFPQVSDANTGWLGINGSGYLGFYTSILGRWYYTTTNQIPLNQWVHIAYQKNGLNIEFYINGVFVTFTNLNNGFSYPNLLNLTQLFIGGATNYSTSTSWHIPGSINQLTISTTLRYSSTITFIPSNILLSDSSTIFFLGDNYKDNISNKTLSYNSAPPLTYTNGNGKDYVINTNIIPTITIYNSINMPVSSININTTGKYVLSYSATDISGNISNIVYRTVYVLNTNTLESYDITNSYLYISNNYNILTSSLFWTIEGWFNITSLLNNGCTIIDFREKPFTSNTGKIAFLINSSGYLGMYLESTYIFTSITAISLNVWNHIAIQRNGIYFEFYINGTFAGQILFNTTLLNFNQLTLGMKNDLSNTDSNYHFKGSISQIKITNSLVYSTCFVPLDDLTPISNTNILFFLGNNLTDSIANTVLTYNTIPINGTKEYFKNLFINNLEVRNLVFNLQCSNLIVSNVSTNSMTWTDSTNNYQFICHPNANSINSLVKVQNNNGWKRTGNIAWTMSDSSNTMFKSLNWINGLTLEQWIYIDYDFIPSTTRMLLVGQSSMFGTYDYGFCFAKEYYTFNTFPYNVLSFATSSAVISQGNGVGAINLQSLKGKWSHLCVTISNINSLTKELKIYINGALLIYLDSTMWSSWSDPYSSSNKFTIGCNSNNGTIQSESLGKIHFGNTRMYNKILNKYEILNNYNYEKSLYNINLNGITYASSISWTMSGGTSTIITNNFEQTINIESNKYIYINNYSVQSNTVYNINFMAMLGTATNLCIVVTNNSGTFNTINGYEFTKINAGLNTNNYVNLNFKFETKSLTLINIYIGNHNQSDIGSQSVGTFKIVNFNISKCTLFNNTLLPTNTLTPITWVRPDGVSTAIVTNNNYQTLYLDNLKYYTILTLTPNTPYNISFWILLGTSTNFCISLRNGLSGSWNIGGYEFTPIKNGLNTNTYTQVSYIFDSKSYTQLILYIGYHSNSMSQQTYGTATIINFTILPIVSNPDYILYNPISDINFNTLTPPIIQSNTITNYDFTTGWLNQTIDYNILRMVPSWTMEVWCYATSWLNGTSNDNNYIFEFSSGTAYFSLGITSNVTNITPTITSDNMGRPFIYYSGDTVSQWKIKSSLTVPLNQWNHIVYQKNSNTQLEMFVNGTSTGTFTINLNDWVFPSFMGNTGLNNIVLGANISNPSSTTNHWKGKLSQPKISLGKIYTAPFTPQFDLSVNNFGLFLLQDNFINNVIGKTMINNNSVIIPSAAPPTVTIVGNNPYNTFYNLPFTDPGYIYNYYLRTTDISLQITNNVNTNIIGKYIVIYSLIYNFNSIISTRNVNIVTNLIPPVITLLGSNPMIIFNGSLYIEPGFTVTSVTGEQISPTITNSINSLINGNYSVVYIAADSSGNSSTVIRSVSVASTTSIYSFGIYYNNNNPTDPTHGSYYYGSYGRYLKFNNMHISDALVISKSWTIECWVFTYATMNGDKRQSYISGDDPIYPPGNFNYFTYNNKYNVRNISSPYNDGYLSILSLVRNNRIIMNLCIDMYAGNDLLLEIAWNDNQYKYYHFNNIYTNVQSFNIDNDVWNHIAITFDGNQIIPYINGVPYYSIYPQGPPANYNTLYTQSTGFANVYGTSYYQKPNGIIKTPGAVGSTDTIYIGTKIYDGMDMSDSNILQNMSKFIGYISQLAIYSNVKYTQQFIPNFDLTPVSNCLFYLGSNYIDLISNTTGIIFTTDAISDSTDTTLVLSRLTINNPALVYTFSGGYIFNNYWSICDNTQGAPWNPIDTTLFNPSSIDFTNGISIAFYRSDALTNNAGFIPLIFIDGVNIFSFIIQGGSRPWAVHGTSANPIYLERTYWISNISFIGTKSMMLFTIDKTGLITIYESSTVFYIYYSLFKPGQTQITNITFGGFPIDSTTITRDIVPYFWYGPSYKGIISNIKIYNTVVPWHVAFQ